MTDLIVDLLDQVEDAVRLVRPLKIVGGGSKLNLLGRDIDKGAHQEIYVGGHRGIVSYEPSELVLTARAGTTIAEIESTLAEHDQVLSFEPPQFNGATLGGSLATNLCGPARPWRSSFRDMVLGVKLINGRSQHLCFGGEVMKNVAGYDLTRLQAGALGSLGLITEISLKVLPRLESSKTLVANVEQHESINLMNQIAGSAAPLTGAVWFDGSLYLRFSGAAKAVRAASSDRKLPSARVLENDKDFWNHLRNQTHQFFLVDQPLWRFSIKSSADVLLKDDPCLIDWGGAQRWVFGDFSLEELEVLAGKAGGHVCLYRGGDRCGEIRQRLDVIQRNIQQQIKLAIDPEKIFNPGILYSWM